MKQRYSQATRDEVLKLREQGKSYRIISQMLNVSAAFISSVVVADNQVDRNGTRSDSLLEVAIGIESKAYRVIELLEEAKSGLQALASLDKATSLLTQAASEAKYLKGQKDELQKRLIAKASPVFGE